ncbi:MAG TPA: hypothetical protein V6C78_07215 [Crinalium sp.]
MPHPVTPLSRRSLNPQFLLRVLHTCRVRKTRDWGSALTAETAVLRGGEAAESCLGALH